MTFWVSATFMVFVAVAIIVVPLCRARLPEASGGIVTSPMRRLALLLSIALPVLSLGLYHQLGAPAILEAQHLLQGTSHDVDGMLTALETRLKGKPDDAEGWYVLGQSYLSLQRVGDAEAALGKAVKLAPGNARILAQYAEALAVLNKGDLQGRVRALIDEALEASPDEEKALELAGLSAFQREEWAQAAYFWRHLLKRLPPGTEFYQDIETALKQARGKAEHSSGPGETAGSSPKTLAP